MTIPSHTQTWHRASYPAIDPTNPSLSVANKTVFVTGGSAGIGLATARVFAAAGTSTVAISGRTASTLRAAKTTIETAHPSANILTFVADVTDQESITAAFSTVGTIDILVHNAAHMPIPALIASARQQDWWSGFETNVKGAFVVAQAFLTVASRDATIVDITTRMVHGPSMPKFSAYGASKLAAHGFFDSLQAENPSLHIVHVHPGVIQTDMSQKALDAGAKFAFDDAELPASFVVWACSPEARFLKGKTVWANWDVEELKARKAEIEAGGMLTTTLDGVSAFKPSPK